MKIRLAPWVAFAALALTGCPDSRSPPPSPMPPPSGPVAPAAPTPPSPVSESAPAPVAVTPEPDLPAASSTAMVLILDTSGSMAEQVGRDGTKIAVAKRVLSDDFLPTLSDDLYLAYYEFERERSPLRRNGRLENAAWSHRETVMELVERASAEGGTPIVQSLARARSVLGGVQAARKVVVLVTDGMDDHGPGGVVRELDDCRSAGLECYVVGFELGDQGRYLEAKLGLGKGYFKANGGRQALLDAMKSVAAAVER